MSSSASIDKVVEDAVDKLEEFVKLLDLVYEYVTTGVRGAGSARKLLRQLKEDKLLNKKPQVRDAVRKALDDYVKSYPRYTTDELRKVAYNALVNTLLDDLDSIAYFIALDIVKLGLDAGVFKGKLEQFTNPLIQPFIGALDRRLEEVRKAMPTTSTTPPTPATPSVLTPKPTPRRPRRERKSPVERVAEEPWEATLPTDWRYIIPPPPDREEEWKDWLESEIRITRGVPLCLKASLIYPYFPWFTFADTGRKVLPVYIGDTFSSECNINGYRDTKFTENYCAIMAPEYYNQNALRTFCDLSFPVLDPNDMDTLYIESATELKRIVKGILQINTVTENLCNNFLIPTRFVEITVEECIDRLRIDDLLLKELYDVMSSIDKRMEDNYADHPYSIPEVERILSTTIMSQILKPSFHEAERGVSHSFFTPFGNATGVPGRALIFLRSLRIIIEIYKRFRSLNSNEAKAELISLYPCESYVYYSPTLNTNLYFTVWNGKCNFNKIKQYTGSLFGLES